MAGSGVTRAVGIYSPNTDQSGPGNSDQVLPGSYIEKPFTKCQLAGEQVFRDRGGVRELPGMPLPAGLEPGWRHGASLAYLSVRVDGRHWHRPTSRVTLGSTETPYITPWGLSSHSYKYPNIPPLPYFTPHHSPHTLPYSHHVIPMHAGRRGYSPFSRRCTKERFLHSRGMDRRDDAVPSRPRTRPVLRGAVPGLVLPRAEVHRCGGVLQAE